MVGLSYLIGVSLLGPVGSWLPASLVRRGAPSDEPSPRSFWRARYSRRQGVARIRLIEAGSIAIPFIRSLTAKRASHQATLRR